MLVVVDRVSRDVDMMFMFIAGGDLVVLRGEGVGSGELRRGRGWWGGGGGGRLERGGWWV